MAVADVHPSIEELTAFTLGTLDEETQASIEGHVAACTSCQERGANAPGDNLVELVRRVRARTSRGADTFVEAAAQVQTPLLLSAVAVTDALTQAVAPSAPAESGRTEVPDALPPELARHERYRVMRLLGAGGMGTVYEAEHRVMQRPVALKVIKRAYTASPAALERFRREVRAAARLSHPNIVTTYDAEDAGETHFLVMEYVEGTDLGRLVKERGPLPVDRACEYARQAALGLQHAFEQGMVHRDLKPPNLMLTPGGCVKILDFGLARFAGEAALGGATGSGMVLGTVDYIAPEQADNAHEADIRSDIYSLGCTLYHLLAGQPPFPTGTPLQKLTAHVNKKPQPLTELRHDLPEGLMLVLERMLAKNPKHRYQTPAEVASALEPFSISTAVSRSPRPRARATDNDWTFILEKKPALVRKWRIFVIATAIMLFLVAGLLGVAVYRIATDKGELVITTESNDVKVVIKQGGKVVDVIDTKTDKQIRLTLRSGEYELELKGAPEGLKLNINRATLKRGETVLATITAGPAAEKVGEVRRFRGHEACVHSVAISPDGRLAASGSGGILPVTSSARDREWVDAPDYSVRLWDMASGREIRRFKGHGAAVTGLAFSKDGSLLASAGSHDHTARIWEVATGKQLHCLRRDNTKSGGVAFLPDGRHVLSAGDDRLLRLWDVKTGKQVGRFEGHKGPVGPVRVSPDGRRIASGSGDKTARLWDAKTGKVLRQFPGHTHSLESVAFSPDGRRLLTADPPSNVFRLWDVESGKELRQFVGHTDQVKTVVFTQDGRRALSGSFDESIRLWDVETGKELHRFTDHTSGVFSLAVSPDGRYVLSGSNDKTVRLWRLPNPPPAKKKP
jgi:WD40 repeat protein